MTKAKKTTKKMIPGDRKATPAYKSKKFLTKKTKPSRPFPVPHELQTEPYWKELNKVIDPELNMGIIDLGLIYDVEIKKSHAHIKMTLTSPACPVGPYILKQVEDRMRLYRDIKSVEIELIWDPVWTQERIDPDIRDLMFGF